MHPETAHQGPQKAPISDASRMTTLKELAREYWANRPMELAAALSYYTLLSLAPLVLMAVAVAGLIFERATVEGRIVAEIRQLVGIEGSEVVQTVLRHASDPEKSAHSVVIGIAVLLIGATSVFVQLQSSLNRIWKVAERTHASMLWVLVKERLLSLAMVLAVGFLLLVSLLVSAAVAAFGETALGGLSDAVVVLEGLNVLVSLGVVTVLFAMIFKVMPDAPVAWRDVWVGAVITAVLFTIGKSLIGLYLGRTSIGSPYGAAGSLVVMTVWVFYASMIVFFGAELTYFRSKRSRR
jgi:membrane protein